jgi:5'-nucleotidase
MNTNSERPLILVTNDDGVDAKGIHALVEVALSYGEVVVVAPNKPQSGMGHAVTIDKILRLNKVPFAKNIEAYACSGTPVDCVKLAIYEVLKTTPTLLLSGINHGGNQAINVLYSGTMSAAVEGAMEGIPSIGFSLLDFHPDADFSVSQNVADQVIKAALKNSFPKQTCLNVNIPKVSQNAFKGIKVCTQANAYWRDYYEKRIDTNGRPYYWLAGELIHEENDHSCDIHALENNFASLVPTQFNLTAFQAIQELNTWKLS